MIVLEGRWEDWDVPEGRTSLTIGVLDGVHRGHRRLLAALDPALRRTVLTFEPHPVEVLRPGTPPRLLTDIDERVRLFGGVGVEMVGVLDLSSIKEQSPDEFVSAVLVDKMGIGQLVVGEDFRFGKDRTGDVGLLAERSAESGFELDVIGILGAAGEPVSSSRIRALIETGDVSAAAALLDSWFTITATVVDGDKRGRELGFPTANLRPPPRKVIPAHGVYACFATIADERLGAAVNVGTRPTFAGKDLLIEAYLLDFEGDLYGADLTLEFVEYLRPELTFDGIGPLVTQMAEDVTMCRDVLERVRSRM